MAAAIVKGQTYGVTEQLTNTKLHNLVDLATISGIINAEISASAAIDESKLSLTGSKLVVPLVFWEGDIVSWEDEAVYS